MFDLVISCHGITCDFTALGLNCIAYTSIIFLSNLNKLESLRLESSELTDIATNSISDVLPIPL